MSDRLTCYVPLDPQPHGRGERLQPEPVWGPDPTWILALGRAFYWQSLLEARRFETGSAIAQAEGLHPSVVNELLRLTLLDPRCIADLCYGLHPPPLHAEWIRRRRLPLDWAEQRRVLGWEGPS